MVKIVSIVLLLLMASCSTDAVSAGEEINELLSEAGLDEVTAWNAVAGCGPSGGLSGDFTVSSEDSYKLTEAESARLRSQALDSGYEIEVPPSSPGSYRIENDKWTIYLWFGESGSLVANIYHVKNLPHDVIEPSPDEIFCD